MIESYKRLFNPKYLGGKFFINTVYLRMVVFTFTISYFMVIFVKLQGQVMTIKEIAILSQLTALSSLFIPILGKFRIRLLLAITLAIEPLIIFPSLLLALDYISVRLFIYSTALLEFIFILVYSNVQSVIANYVQRYTPSNTAEYRNRGYMLVIALATLASSLVVILLDTLFNSIKVLLLGYVVLGIIQFITVYITNKRILVYCSRRYDG